MSAVGLPAGDLSFDGGTRTERHGDERADEAVADGQGGPRRPPRLERITNALGLSGTGRRMRTVTSMYSRRALDQLREHGEAIRDVLAKYGASKARPLRCDRA